LEEILVDRLGAFSTGTFSDLRGMLDVVATPDDSDGHHPDHCGTVTGRIEQSTVPALIF
jgi:hypothetical protein